MNALDEANERIDAAVVALDAEDRQLAALHLLAAFMILRGAGRLRLGSGPHDEELSRILSAVERLKAGPHDPAVSEVT